MSNIYLYINVAVWVITFLIYQNKKKHFDVGSVLILSYLIYSISSVIVFNSTYGYNFNELTLFPFLYLYLITILVMSPVLNIYKKNIDIIQKPSNILFYSIITIYIISSLIYFVSSLSDIYDGIYTVINDPMGGIDLYVEKMESSFDVGDRKISNIFAIFSNLLSDIGILLFFYYLTFKKKNKLILFGFLFSIFASMLAPLAVSQRGPAIDRLFTVIMAYFALKEFIPVSINKKIKKIGIVLLLLFSVPMIAITVSRFGERVGGVKESVFNYIGQQNLNFNNYAFDNDGLRYGDRVFPLFKRMLGFNNVPYNFWERRIKYPNLKINDEVFIGFVGDFVLDFGTYLASIILIIFTIYIYSKTRIKNRTLLFHQLILLFLIMNLCMIGGLKLFPFADTGGNLVLIVYMLVYIAFKLDYKNSLNQKKQVVDPLE